VVVPRLMGCGDCAACRRGRLAHCPARPARHGLGAEATVPARWLTSVEPPLWPDGAELWQLAALADAALAPYSALSRAGVGPGDTVLVVGRDARAQFAAALAVAKGAKVVADDGASAPTDGAFVLSTGASERMRAVDRLAPGVTLMLLDGDADADTAVGAADPAAAATAWSRVVDTEARVLGCVSGHPDLLPELCALLVRGQLPLADAVRRVTPGDAVVAHAAYRRSGGPLPIAVFV
jgi:D-arabinose 1-dehydrogenase-like Zn-dependent alcohol dehydrogenase